MADETPTGGALDGGAPDAAPDVAPDVAPDSADAKRDAEDAPAKSRSTGARKRSGASAAKRTGASAAGRSGASGSKRPAGSGKKSAGASGAKAASGPGAETADGGTRSSGGGAKSPGRGSRAAAGSRSGTSRAANAKGGKPARGASDAEGAAGAETAATKPRRKRAPAKKAAAPDTLFAAETPDTLWATDAATGTPREAPPEPDAAGAREAAAETDAAGALETEAAPAAAVAPEAESAPGAAAELETSAPAQTTVSEVATAPDRAAAVEAVPPATAAEAGPPTVTGSGAQPGGETLPDGVARRRPGAPRRASDSRRGTAPRRVPRLRAAASAFLVLAALLGVVASAVALWSRDLVFDTDAYVAVVAPVLDDPAARSSIADYVAAKAVQAADLNDRIEAALPSAAKMTAPALTRALQQFLRNEIERFLGTDVARRLWVDVNRAAHREFITALEGQNASVTVGREDVKVDLVPLVAVALQRLEAKVPDLLGKDVTLPPIDPSSAPQDIRIRLQDALGRELPAGFGTVTLIRGDEGYQLQHMLERLDRLSVLVVAATIVLVVAALLVSVHRRRTALWLGLGALLAFAAARVLERQLERAAADAVATSGGAAVARSVLTATVSSLDAYFVWVAVSGAVVAVAALLAGKPAWLQAMGRAFAGLFGVASDLSTPDTRAGRWMHEHLDVLRVGGVAVAVGALLFVAGSWAGVAAVVLALVIYELVLTTYGAGLPRQPDQTPDETRSADEGDAPAA